MLMHLQRNKLTKVVIKIVFLGYYLDENLCLAMALCKCFAVLSQLRPFCCFQSTYCTTILQHCENVQRSVHVVNLDPAAEHFGYPVLAGECIINNFQFFALFHFFSVIINMTMKFSIEYRSDDVIKMKFVKLWDLLRYSERTTSKTPTRQKLAIRAKLSLRYQPSFAVTIPYKSF